VIKPSFLIAFLLFSFQLIAEESVVREQEKLFSEINRFRTEQGLNNLREDPLLNRCAADYALVMLEQGYLGHIDQQGNRALQRYQNLGGTANRVGENLASLAPMSPWSKVLTLWIESPTHLEVLKQDWLTMGISLMELEGKRVAVALFSNSLLLDDQESFIFSTEMPIYLFIPSEGIEIIQEGPRLDLSPYKSSDWRLLEIRDMQHRLHNRILISPAGYREDSE